MTVLELYEALNAAGVEESVARRAAQDAMSPGRIRALEDHTHLATHAELRLAIVELRLELWKWLAVTLLVAVTALLLAALLTVMPRG